MQFRVEASGIRVSLPITTPTEKVRVKRPRPSLAPAPVACRSVPLEGTDYLEWQISYDTDNLHDPSVLRNVEIRKPSGIRYGCELIRLIHAARQQELLPEAGWRQMLALVNEPLDAGIEEREPVVCRPAPPAAPSPPQFGFERFVQEVPDYLKRTPAYTVEIKIAPKQRAVGNQAMIYVHLPVARCTPTAGGEPLIGRLAARAEMVDYLVDAASVPLLEDTVTAFALASRAHREDLRQLLGQL